MVRPPTEIDRSAAKPTVLIVDDEMDMRLYMSTLFDTSGYHAVAVRDGRLGLAKAMELHPCLIVLDVMMPGEGGAAMYKALKSDARLYKIPVLMLSAVAEATFKHYLVMLNSQITEPLPPPDGYMEKPPEASALLALARQLIAAAMSTDRETP